MNKMIKAFSLIEAMIILLMISISIMAMIPLISQKSTTTGLQSFKANNNGNFILFGQKVNQKIGIGLNPQDLNDVTAKLYTNTTGINYSEDPTISINIGRNDTNADSAYEYRAAVANDILIGQNTCTAGISIGSNANGNCATPNGSVITIGQDNATSITSSDNDNIELNVIGSDNTLKNLIKVDDDTFDIKILNNAGNNTEDIFSYNAAGDLTLGKNINVGGGGAGTVTMSHNDFANPVADNPRQGNNVCSSADQNCNNNSYYSTVRGAGATFNDNPASDKRLKNIIANYTKGIGEVKKIDTYRYTYKSDKKAVMQVGLIAQKIIGVFDEALHKDEKGFYSYERTPILYAMVNSVKNLATRIDVLTKQGKYLNNRADKLLKKYE